MHEKYEIVDIVMCLSFVVLSNINRRNMVEKKNPIRRHTLLNQSINQSSKQSIKHEILKNVFYINQYLFNVLM